MIHIQKMRDADKIHDRNGQGRMARNDFCFVVIWLHFFYSPHMLLSAWATAVITLLVLPFFSSSIFLVYVHIILLGTNERNRPPSMIPLGNVSGDATGVQKIWSKKLKRKMERLIFFPTSVLTLWAFLFAFCLGGLVRIEGKKGYGNGL